MTAPFSGKSLWAAGVVAGVGVAMRLHNAFHYPPDWGFDAPFNWRYIYRMSRDWALPHPAAGWSTSDPPLFFTLAAALWRAAGENVVVVPLLNTLFGLLLVALAVALAMRLAPGDARRAVLAGGLLLFLPAHVQMSVMVSEEMLAALFTSATLFLLVSRPPLRSGGGARRAASVGLAAGLALLSKLSGAAAGITALLVFGIDGVRQRAAAAIPRAAVVLAVATLAGGWFYVRNQTLYGYVQPQHLPIHERMFDLPPGKRGLSDYLYVPLATWTDPQLRNEDLVRSVWGSTYATAWFDGHRFLLPRVDPNVTRLGTVTLLLALLPTLAFGAGYLRAAARVVRDPAASELPLVLCVPVLVAAYVYFTWRNPYFAVVKGTTLLPLALPFATFASEALADWTRRRGPARALVWTALAALAVCVVAGNTFGLVFEKTEVSGLP